MPRKTKPTAIESLFPAQYNWMGTSHSREFWIAEFSGRALVALLGSEKWNAHIADNVDYIGGETETILCCKMAVELARRLVEQIEPLLLQGVPDAPKN